MTFSTVTFWHCDASGCTQKVREKDSADWAHGGLTHGCPEHAAIIAEHAADLTSRTAGRGYKEKTTWFLHCKCGWRPTPYYSTHRYDYLQATHLAHVKEVTR